MRVLVNDEDGFGFATEGEGDVLGLVVAANLQAKNVAGLVIAEPGVHAAGRILTVPGGDFVARSEVGAFGVGARRERADQESAAIIAFQGEAEFGTDDFLLLQEQAGLAENFG